MEYKFNYLNDKKEVILYTSKKEMNYNSINENIHLKISLEKKTIEKIYDFFKQATVNAILNKEKEITFNYDDITCLIKEDDALEKLIKLLDELLVIVNKTLISVIR